MNSSSDRHTASVNGNLGSYLLYASIAAIGGFLFGFDSGVINGTVEALGEAFGSTAAGRGFNVASMLLGCAVGAFFAGSMADRFGRRAVMLVTAALFVASAWGSGASTGSAQFVLFRVMGGVAVGGASILAPAYISEISPPQIRGRLATLQQLMIVIGLFTAFLSNYLIAGAAGGAAEILWGGFEAWRWMFWAEMIPASVYLFSLLLIPESPRYLVAAGRPQKAEEILTSLLGSERAGELVARIRQTVHQQRRPRLSDILEDGSRRLRRIVWVGLGLSVLQQFTGINVVFYYGAVLWQAAGFTEADALMTNVISGSVNIFFTVVAILLIDRVGRRPLLLVGALGQAVMLGVMAIIFTTGEISPDGELQLSSSQGTWALMAANGYIAFFATTWGPVLWVLMGEMFPNQFRGAALAVCGFFHWISNFTVTLTFPILLTTIGLGMAYGIYAVFGFVAWLFVRYLVRETRGRTLEELSIRQTGEPQVAEESSRKDSDED